MFCVCKCFLNFVAYITQVQFHKRDYLSVGDLVVADLRVQSAEEADGKQICKAFFGYVQHLEKVFILKNHHMINAKGKPITFMKENRHTQVISVADQLSGYPFAQVNFKLLVKKIEAEIITDKFTYFKVITSLVSFSRLFNALKQLPNSPLCKFILNPELLKQRPPLTPLEPVAVKVPSSNTLNSIILVFFLLRNR